MYKNMQIKNKATKCGVKRSIYLLVHTMFRCFFTKIISDSYLHSVVSLHEPSTEVRTG